MKVSPETRYLSWFNSKVREFGLVDEDLEIEMQNQYEKETGMQVPEEFKITEEENEE